MRNSSEYERSGRSRRSAVGGGNAKKALSPKSFALTTFMLITAAGLISCRSTYSRTNIALYGDMRQMVPIMSRGSAEVRHLVRFVLRTHPSADQSEVRRIARYYISEAAAEGVNHDVAFCQMCLETNYLRFGGDVGRWQNNFCGLGATGGGASGSSFKTMQIGVRAHIQHLKAYASERPLRRQVVDPRFGRVRRGTAPYVKDLTRKWATDPYYGSKIRTKLRILAGYL